MYSLAWPDVWCWEKVWLPFHRNLVQRQILLSINKQLTGKKDVLNNLLKGDA